MTELDQDALDAMEHRGKNLVPRDLLTVIERYDEATERGVPMDMLEAYTAELAERGVPTMDLAELDTHVQENRTGEDTWVGNDSIYEVGDGLSAFPARWHDELTGETNIRKYVDVLSEDVTSTEDGTETGSSGHGVPQQLLLDAGSSLGPYSRDGVKAEIEDLREQGEVQVPADQNPSSRVVPAEAERKG